MKYLNSLNHYRALSIILIVAIHVPSFADLTFETYPGKFLFNLISGATLNFIFISGFLFYQVFYKRFQYKDFVKSRVDRFLKPYLILSVLPILICLVTIPVHWDNSSITELNGNPSVFWHLISVLKYIVTGAHITAYWYIPFMMIMVLMSPLFVAFVKLKLKTQLIIFGVLLITASLVQRPYERTELFQAFHSVVYFTPIYLMGIVCGIHREKIYTLLKGKEIYLLSMVLLITAWQTGRGDHGLYQNEFFNYNGVGLIIFKMVFFCLFFMIWLHRFEQVKSPVINHLAATSFAIYFLHVYFLKAITSLKAYFNLNFENYAFMIYLAAIGVLIVMSMITAKLINKLLPNHSFYIIGYGKKPIEVSKPSKLKNPMLSKSEA